MSKLKIYNNRYIKKIGAEPLGSGGFARIYHIEDLKTHIDYAMKEILVTEEGEIKENDLKREINIMKDVKSENSIKIFDCFKENYNYYIIMEKCDNNLYNLIEKKKQRN